jgi:CDP-glucose 4,6-dehydratase
VEDGAAAYMLLAEQLHCRPDLHGLAFNFSIESEVTVLGLVNKILRAMDSSVEPKILNEASNEIRRQYLSASRARMMLKWSPLFTLDQGIERTVSWYREFLA